MLDDFRARGIGIGGQGGVHGFSSRAMHARQRLKWARSSVSDQSE
jgi:hypothetical protein